MGCIKIVEVIGCSEKGFDEAVRTAFERAKKTVRNITGMKVTGQNIKVEKDRIKEYRVSLKVAFEID